MNLTQTKKQLLLALSDYEQISNDQVKLKDLLKSAFPDQEIPNNVQDALQILFSNKYINAVEINFKIVSASITPAGEKYLEALS